MEGTPKKHRIEITKRRLNQDMRRAVRDIFDALVELVTNSDDRYQILSAEGLSHNGRIDIEIERRRGEAPTILRVRDFADGMTLRAMDTKLGKSGNMVSGLEAGASVRGTNSRGAKDVQALGPVTFESIAREDGQYHACRLDNWDIDPIGSRQVTGKIRRDLKIVKGTGTVVTIELRQGVKVQQHENLLELLRKRVVLRDILSAQDRTVNLIDVNQGRSDMVKAPIVEAHDRVKETLAIPGYPDATAKLVIRRAGKQFLNEHAPYRLGGIVVKSRHAIHEATYFDTKLNHDPHAAWFVGKLRCEYIDQLWTEHDGFEENGVEPPETNPFPILDPMRRGGLDKDHPFVKALFQEAAQRLRRLVEEERKQAESNRAKVENDETRKRLNQLEKLASKFLLDETNIEESSRDPNTIDRSPQLRDRGYTLSPPFCKLVVGKPRKFWLNINTEVFPEIQEGDSVQVRRLSTDLHVSPSITELEMHPEDPKILRAIWAVTGEAPSTASGINVSVGPVKVDATMEIVATEADLYKHITELQFSSKRYKVPADGSRKPVKVLCPVALAPEGGLLSVEISSRAFRTKGHCRLVPKPNLGISVATFGVVTTSPEARAEINVKWGAQSASADLLAGHASGVGIKIGLADIDLGAQRSRWKSNVLEIATKHPSISRYLGPKSEGFPGQNEKHFRLLVAEIVADAVVQKSIAHNDSQGEYDDEPKDWDFFYFEYHRLMSKLLPQAHRLQMPDVR